MGKVLTLPPMRVNAIFLRISLYVPRLLWSGVKFISNWTFELSEQVVTTKISHKCYILVIIRQVHTIFYCLNDVSVNSRSVFICAKLDELKLYVYTAKHTKCYTGFSNSGSDLIINGTDVDREPQRQVIFINTLQSLSSDCAGWLHFGLSRCWLWPTPLIFFLIVRS